MKNLLYLFLIGLLMSGCRGNRYYLDKVEAWEGVNNDSLAHYLHKVDSASLSPEERNVYDYYRLRASYPYLVSLAPEQLDEMTGRLEKHYSDNKRKLLHIGMTRATYATFWQGEHAKADSVLNALRALLQQREDSAYWYYYKCRTKYHLREMDSASYYVREWLAKGLVEKYRAYNTLGNTHEAVQQPDSALFYFWKAMEHSTGGKDVYAYGNRVLDKLIGRKDFPRAFEALKQLRGQMKRSDIPFVNLVEGDLWMELHLPDSAMKHYRIATRTGNAYVAMVAYERMGDLMERELDFGKAFDMRQKAFRTRGELYTQETFLQENKDIMALRVKHQLAELKLERQQHLIIIMGLCLFVLALVGVSLFHFYRKRTIERKRLVQENVLLRQQEELATLREKQMALREKEARLREELFKRLSVFEKLTSSGKEQHVLFSESDWLEVRLMVNDAYTDFTKKLQKAFPGLSDKDVNFCCLVRMNLSLQSLADIYCISKNSVSRRKLRLKEKMALGENATLDEYLSLL